MGTTKRLDKVDLDKMGLLSNLHDYAEFTTPFTRVRVTDTYCSSKSCYPKGNSSKGILVDKAREGQALNVCPKCGKSHLFHKTQWIKR